MSFWSSMMFWSNPRPALPAPRSLERMQYESDRDELTEACIAFIEKNGCLPTGFFIRNVGDQTQLHVPGNGAFNMDAKTLFYVISHDYRFGLFAAFARHFTASIRPAMGE